MTILQEKEMRLDHGFLQCEKFKPGWGNEEFDELKKNSNTTAVIQEIKWRGNDVFHSKDYTVCYSGSSGARNILVMDSEYIRS
jgi:hypothetical protein